MCKKVSVFIVSLLLFLVFCTGCFFSAHKSTMALCKNVGYNPCAVASFNKKPSSLLELFIDWLSALVENNENNKTETDLRAESVENKGVEVFIGGRPIGFSLSSSGVVVVEKSSVLTADGEKNPLEESDILLGDVLIEIEGEKVFSGSDVVLKVNNLIGQKQHLLVTILRGEKRIETTVEPALDCLTGTYRLGLWVRDNAVGVGTITYVQDDGKFSALGHPVTDIDTGVIIPVNYGQLFKCSIVGVNKGRRGVAGELRGLFLQSQNTIGEISENSHNGLFGHIDADRKSEFCGQKMELACIDEIKIGKAQIYTTIDGSEPEFYDIEIVKNNYVNSENKECMIIKVIDSDLIEKTGGIVQGMSGSPIVQNDKLVGCVTHVFINDPTKGFADFIKFQ